MNLCVVAGPRDCKLIRYTYLRCNSHYPLHYLAKYVGERGALGGALGRKTCGDRYRAWMEINNRWKCLVTDARIRKFASVRPQTSASANNPQVSVHPLYPLNNPAVAIELGLMEPLKHLVEEMNIDVNSYQWNNYHANDGGSSHHLLAVCIICEHIEAFQYLLSRDDIKINVKMTDGWYLNIAMQAFIAPQATRFLRDLIGHRHFDLDTCFFSNGETLPPLIWAMEYHDEEFDDLTTFQANFKLLLAAGADPFAIAEGLDGLNAIQFAEEKVESDPESQGMKAALGILKDWEATNAKESD